MRKEDPLVLEILSLHESNDFLGILRKIKELCESQSEKDKESLEVLRLLTWPSPTREDLFNFSGFINSLGVTHIFSVGCGTGLLEWLMLKVILEQSSGKEFEGVTGIEIDYGWWSSSYSPPMFLPLRFVDKDFDCREDFGKSSDLALFCYFNNLKVFLEYLDKFRGNFIGILGPMCNTQFCEPAPLELVDNPEMPRDKWKLVWFKPFGFGNVDHLAIYQKNSS